MMKKHLIILTLLFTLMFSSTSYAEWTKYNENDVGDRFYLDFDRIRKHDGYVYYWRLSDYLKPTEFGDLSVKVYMQGDCKLFRIKGLSLTSYKYPMGEGDSDTETPSDEWIYPHPEAGIEKSLNYACNNL